MNKNAVVLRMILGGLYLSTLAAIYAWGVRSAALAFQPINLFVATAVLLLVPLLLLDALLAPRWDIKPLWRWLRPRSSLVTMADTSLLQERVKALQARLDLDEPRVCNHSGAPCTIWSLCGRTDNLPPDGPDGVKRVERHNIKECPYTDGRMAPPAPDAAGR